MTEAGPELTLVGVVHRDPRGRALLAQVLDRLRPDLITLQLSPYALRFRRGRAAAVLAELDRNLVRAAADLGLSADAAAAHGAVQCLRAQLAVPFEFLAAREYARTHPCRVRLIDDSGLSRVFIARLVGESIQTDNLVQLLRSPDIGPEARARGEWRRARWAGEGTIDPAGPPLGRDRRLARGVLAAQERFSPRAHVFVCGWMHLPGLALGLTGRAPRVIRLDGGDDRTGAPR